MHPGERRFKILVCEDEPKLLANLKNKIERSLPEFEVVATAEDGYTAAALLADKAVDVLVTDIRMPGLNGLELIKLVADRHPRVKTVVISGYDEFDYAQRAIRYGSLDYILKPVTTGQLEETFTRVRMQLEKSDVGLEKLSCGLDRDRFYSPKTVVSVVQGYIQGNYMRDISVDSLSRHFHVTPSYLCKVFAKYAGIAPSKYITSIRIEIAKSLFAQNPSLLVREVGELVGYPDQCYFSRVFKNATGTSPEAFRAGTC
jgi:two-component system, response regulator YesN